jgi:hypothetical protein
MRRGLEIQAQTIFGRPWSKADDASIVGTRLMAQLHLWHIWAFSFDFAESHW